MIRNRVMKAGRFCIDMNSYARLLLTTAIFLSGLSCAEGQEAAYRNPRLSIEERVADLLSRMTLEEKAVQMTCVWQQKAALLLDAQGNFSLEKARANFGHGNGLGQVGRPSDAGGGKNARQTAELTNAIQRFFLENSRLGIPVFFHEECLHGHAAKDATSFPQPIGLGSTFDTDLVHRIFTITALEARSRGRSPGEHLADHGRPERLDGLGRLEPLLQRVLVDRQRHRLPPVQLEPQLRLGCVRDALGHVVPRLDRPAVDGGDPRSHGNLPQRLPAGGAG